MADVRSNPSDILDLTSRDVIDLDAPEVVDTGPASLPWWRRLWWRGWVAVGLVAVVVAAIGLAGWQYRERTAYASTPQWAAVTAYVDASNANDLDRVRLSVTDDVVWTGYDPLGRVQMSYVGEDYITFYKNFLPTFHIDVIGQPTVYANDVAVPVHISAPNFGVDYDAVTVFSVRDVSGVPTVEAIMAIPTTA